MIKWPWDVCWLCIQSRLRHDRLAFLCVYRITEVIADDVECVSGAAVVIEDKTDALPRDPRGSGLK
jgi:hypothetical protein